MKRKINCGFVAQRSHYFSFSLPHSGFRLGISKDRRYLCTWRHRRAHAKQRFLNLFFNYQINALLPSQQMSECNFSISKKKIITKTEKVLLPSKEQKRSFQFFFQLFGMTHYSYFTFFWLVSNFLEVFSTIMLFIN